MARNRQIGLEQVGWSRSLKMVVSGLVVLQLLAITAEPFRFFTRSSRGTSPAADPARQWLAPYLEFAYLNHGYFFFAPEPGPSHLMECRLSMPTGTTQSLVFPDKTKQWPRLLYHRHFMLAEFLQQLHVPPYQADIAGEDVRLARDWQAERALFERVRGSMSAHVAAKYGATAATIERIEHRLPSDDEVFRQRLALDSPTLYLVLPDAPLDPLPPLQPPALQPGGGVLLQPLAPLESIGPAGEAVENAAGGAARDSSIRSRRPQSLGPATANLEEGRP